MAIKIYKDAAANAIFIEDANGVQFLNSLHATVDNDVCTIHDIAKQIEIVSNATHADFIDQSDNGYGTTATEVCDALNALFASSGTSTGSVPSITSGLAITLVEGQTLNYELTADYGVGYEWDLSSVSGVANVEGNVRKLVGGSGLSAGTYNIPVKAINYNGVDNQTLVLTVSTPAFASTRSVKFENLDYLDANASLVNSSLGRSANGSGSSDAWTISMWVKPTATENNQTLFFYGGDDANNEGRVWLRYFGSDALQAVRLEYGSDNNYLRLLTPTSSFPRDQWTHLIVSYDGGTTGVASGSTADYYSRFKMYANGVLQSTSNSNRNSGWAGTIKNELFRVGRKGLSTFYMRSGCKVDELAVWGSDQSSNASDIYNSGNTHDLSLLTTSPNHFWRMGDGDTYPTIQDVIGSADFTMVNMTSADIVNDTP